MHRTIKKVGEDIESLKFNTAIAAMMSLLNEFSDKGASRGEFKTFLILLNPFAPHITEEMFERLGFEGMVTEQSWPEYDEEKCKDTAVQIAIQVNGKIRARLDVAADISKEDAIALAKEAQSVAAELAGKNILKEIYVPGKLVNIVAR